MSKTRQEIANKEATRDPIFLFQRCRVIITDRSRVDYCNECESVYIVGEKDHDCSDVKPTKEDLISWEAAMETWDTEKVFLTREEGTAYGNAKHYNYSDGWRVYCVCAEGSLAEILGRAF